MDDPAPTRKEFNDILNIEKFKEERVELLSKMYKRLAELYSVERDIIIYRMIKGGYISAYKMSDLSELTPNVIYRIIKRVEKGDYK